MKEGGVKGRYGITYENGIYQEKNLISHIDYEEIIKPQLRIADELEIVKRKQEADRIKLTLVNMFGEHYFTDKSPLYEAITTGILSLPYIQGGSSKCSISKL